MTTEAAGAAERQRDGQRRQSSDGLDPDPAPEMGLGGQQAQRPGRRRAPSDGRRVLARAAGERGVGA
ncbi:MAG TPA: hypothetical protein VF087_05035 [Solirubrobacteraceae bacterium]